MNREDRFFQRRIITFTGNVHRACRHCRAPGQYIAASHTFPQLVDIHREGEPVGPVCPVCGGGRSANVKRVTHRREWWVFRLPRFMTRIMEFIDTR